MRFLKIFYFALGLLLLGLVVAEIDLAEVAAHVTKVGSGILVLVGIYFAAFAIDSITWQLTIRGVPLDFVWAYRIWKLRMVGESFNAVIPAGGMGGEPVKALMMKSHYGIDYREGTASLILAKTINMIALVIFLIGGFALMIQAQALPRVYEYVAGAGLLAFAIGVFLFFVIQRLSISSLTGTWLSQWRIGRRIEDTLHHIHDMDERLVHFYTMTRGRFAAALTLALINWMLGVVEIYFALVFLDRPITWAEAWIIEAVAQMVRTGAFFIPAAIGVQEGAFLLVCGAITGSAPLGLAVSVIRRIREIIWIVWGFAVGALYSIKSPKADEA
ncbi:MAG: flippase-like domain-containing protein [Rhodospirillales bacterium]|nr:flippase-like domain-containing protein [Alphaproteobacteria bacterium]MBL6948507.1 flippase-like domain-containing protein [Rhodospirillales bacterium]